MKRSKSKPLAPSKARSPLRKQKELKKLLSDYRSVPQNFNSYRHVITRSTNGDDLKWVTNLRESIKIDRIE